MSQKPFPPTTTIAVKAGTKYEPFDLDIGGWHGRIVGQVEEGDYLVRWDKPTMEAIPGWVIASWVETGEDWSCMEVEAGTIRRARARDQEDDWFDALCQRLQEQGITPNFLSAPAFVTEMTDFYGEYEDEEEDEEIGLELFDPDDFLSGDPADLAEYLGLSSLEFDDDEALLEGIDADDFADDFADDIDDDFDDDDDFDPFDDESYWEPFDFDEFVTLLQIPRAQQKPLYTALAKAKDAYYETRYMSYSYPLTADAFIFQHMGSPYVFGFGLVNVLNNGRLSRLTKIKVCQYALDQIDPLEDEGIPYGLVNMLAFLAREGLLVMPVFSLLLFTLDYTRRGLFTSYNWLEDLTDKSELVDLITWLGQVDEMEEEELLWWFWRFSMMCHEVHHSWGKALAAIWKETERVTAATKKQLYRGWLEDWETAGSAPLAWQMTDAQSSGDVDSLLALYDQAGITPSQEEIDFLQEHAEEVRSVVEESFLFMRRHWTAAFYTPPYFKRLAILELARLGEPVAQLIEHYWDSEPDSEMVNQGLADALAEFHEQLSPEALQTYIERGLNHGSLRTRRPFFELSLKLYGDKYLSQALQDEAKSIQTWAKKQAR
jgi:hypothetical protein